MELKVKSESLRTNFIYNLIYQVVVVLTPLILTPKLSRVFGASFLGIKGYTFSIVYYFAVFGLLGLDMLGQRKIAIVKDDPEKRNKIFSTIFVTRLFLVLMSTLLYVGFLSFFSNGFEQVIFLCWLIYLVREMINPIWFLQGIEKYRVLSILNILSQVAYVALTFIFIKQTEVVSEKQHYLVLYVIFFTAIPLLVSLCYFPFVFKYARFVKLSPREMANSVKESFVYFVPTIATAVYSMVDKTMLGLFDSTKESTGLYEAAEKLVKVALAISTASFTIMRTRMCYLYGQNNQEVYRDHCRGFISFSMMLCWPILFGIIGISKDFVPVFFGSGFESVVNLSYVFAFVVPLLTVSGLLQAIFIFPFGLQKTMDLFYLIVVAANVLLNLLFIFLFGLGTVGAVIASLTSETLLVIFLLIKARKDIEIFYILRVSVKYVISSLVMLAAMLVFSRFVELQPILKVLFEFLVGVGTYFVFCIVLRDGFILNNLKLFLKKVFPARNKSE